MFGGRFFMVETARKVFDKMAKRDMVLRDALIFGVNEELLF